MNETQTEFETEQAGLTQNEKVFCVLLAKKGEWVSLLELVTIGGGFAIHSRISDLRKRGYNIENHQDRSKRPYRSFYKLTP